MPLYRLIVLFLVVVLHFRAVIISFHRLIVLVLIIITLSFPFFHVLNNRNCVLIFDFVTLFNGCFQEFHLRENIFFLVKIDLAAPGDFSKRHEALGGQGDRKEQLFLLLVGEEGLDANDFVSLS